MLKINILPEQLRNQISAGEVVERPSSIVKEMIENSIDAGAKKIVIELIQGGLKLIKINDDGCGMSPEDTLMSLERYATSKIKNLEDLQNIQTMGFRGEALASIASVSKMTIQTRIEDNLSGVEIYAEGGKIMKQSPIGMNIGTSIEVRDLFYNTPARLKFIKNEKTEYQDILDILTDATLAWPNVAFKLIKHSEESTDIETGELKEEKSNIVLDLPATEDLSVRIQGILGNNISNELISIYYGGVNVKIDGFIGKPALSRANRNQQFFFVNHRPIKSYVLSYAVKQAFHSLLPKERYPVFIINFHIDPSLVDVNCHPRKTEIKFHDEKEIFRVLSMSCKKALEENVLMPKFNRENINYYQEKSAKGLGFVEFQNLESKEKISVKVAEINETSPVQIDEEKIDQSFQVEDFSEKEMIVLAQLDKSFILCQYGRDLVLIDQHAAHERVRYNLMMENALNEEMAIQPLLMPINFELALGDQEVLNNNKVILDQLGVKIEHFGGNTFAISEVPSFMTKLNLENLILGLVDDLKMIKDYGDSHNVNAFKGDLFARKEKILTYMACRSAVKFGDELSHIEMISLIDQLNKTKEGKATCPHGRPTMIILESDELWSRFGRKYPGFFENEKFRGINC